ncbi:transcriptional activator FtrA [Variovorax sp. SRS16]|uniref:AraC family transcriptional regulator n=1 Tax=Variovorax sp. SRS16 TaxID=282217 RepID=UPI0013184330|nr:transcriptional activator FtrA [Variovorax sp. SRS16]
MDFASPRRPRSVSVGVALSGLCRCRRNGGSTWIVLLGLPGHTIAVDSDETQELLHWLRGQHFERDRLELITVCAGALLAAHAGQLAGRRATTHHHHLDELRQVEPRCEVVSNRVFVLDPPVYSSARRDDRPGPDAASHCEPAAKPWRHRSRQTMVMALRRGPQDPELSPFLAYRNHLHAALHRVQDAVSGQPQDDWTVPRMAEVAHTSARHLTRLFVEHAGIAPLEYLRRLRLATASWRWHPRQRHGRPKSRASAPTQLRRAWHQFGDRIAVGRAKAAGR